MARKMPLDLTWRLRDRLEAAVGTEALEAFEANLDRPLAEALNAIYREIGKLEQDRAHLYAVLKIAISEPRD